MQKTVNINVRETIPLITPAELKIELPMTEQANETVVSGRETIKNILSRKDDRLLVIVGPCSIHDEKAALDYARKLAEFKKTASNHLYIVMRVYFEKPRTTIGWKGLINDPHLDGSYDVPEGLRRARRLLLQINEMGLPAATEVLDPIVPQYIGGLVSWAAIGARTTESQTHREMASGLSMPIGFKNSTDGNLQIAIDAMQSARHPHTFLGVDELGKTSLVKTTGNLFGHVILRGGKGRPNYDPESVREAETALKNSGIDPLIMVDCSHANSEKIPENQEVVWKNIIAQRMAGNKNLVGLMLESNLFAGNQKISDIATMKYGVSVTDACIGWETTVELLNFANQELARS